MKTKLLFLFLAFSLIFVTGQVQTSDSTYRKFFISSTFFMLGNLFPDDPNSPAFILLNFGYRVTPKGVISIGAKTWKYAWSLGIPYGKSFELPEEKYHGHISDYGIALACQRFWWEGTYTAIHAMNTLQKYG